MEDVIESVKSGGLSVRAAAAEWGVPRSTLRDRLKGDGNIRGRGRPRLFSAKEEEGLEELAISCAELGVPISKMLFMKVARNFAVSLGKFICLVGSIDSVID